MLIGLNGAKGAGKDTVGSHLVSEHGFEKLSFAQLLKDSAGALFGVDPKMWDEWKNDVHVRITINTAFGVACDMTARQFLQRYGTESHRDVFGQDFWVDALMNERRPYFLKDYCVTDARFPNELKAISRLGGQNWRIQREAVNDGDGHISEAKPDFRLIAWTIDNDGTVEELQQEVDAYLKFIKSENAVPAGV